MESGHRKRFQPAVEKDAAGFFASGRRHEFEKRIADLKSALGRQRSSATLGSQLLRTETTVALKLGYIVRTFPNRNTSSPYCQPRSFTDTLSSGSDSVARATSRSNFGDQESGFTVVGTPAAGIACSGFAAFFDLVCLESNGRVGSSTCGNAQSQVEKVRVF